jgi:hypothetical protein
VNVEVAILVVERAVVVNEHLDEGGAVVGLLVHAQHDDLFNALVDLQGLADVGQEEADGQDVLGPGVVELPSNLL